MSKVIATVPLTGGVLGDTYMVLIDRMYPMYFDDEASGKKYLIEHGIPEQAVEDVVFRHSIGTCFRCGSPLFPSQIEGYTSHCFTCNEDFFSFEQEADYLRKAMSDVLQVPQSALFALEHEEQQP